MGMPMSRVDGDGRIRGLSGSYEDLEKHVGQANEWARHCPIAVQLRFRVLLREDDGGSACECIPFTWTLGDVVKVQARKLRRHDESTIDTPQDLSVGQFYSMYCYLSNIHECASRRPAAMATVDDKGHRLREDDADVDTECQICMDASNEVVLPCTHSFCLECFHSWHARHNTCPTCRQPLPRQHSDECKELWTVATLDHHDLAAYIQDLVANALHVLDRW
ncbi:hypothetical protein H310_12072, partial [Aphanomyces invadans]